MRVDSSAHYCCLVAAALAMSSPGLGQETSAGAAADDGAVVLPSGSLAPTARPKEEAARGVRVAVYELKLQEVPERIGQVATNSLLAETRKLQRVSAVSMDEVKDMLTHAENQQLLGCDDESCMAEIAGALGVDELITGSLGRVGGSSVVNIRRIDMNTARVIATFDQRLEQSDGEEFLVAIGPAIEQLFPEYPLRDGLERGVPDSVAMRLNPPPLPAWVFWTTSGSAAGLALLSVGATVASGLAYAAHNDLAASGVPPGEPIQAAELDDLRGAAQGWDVARWTLLGGAGVLAIVAGFEAIFTDWHGYGESER